MKIELIYHNNLLLIIKDNKIFAELECPDNFPGLNSKVEKEICRALEIGKDFLSE